jgi:hypothetical protein
MSRGLGGQKAIDAVRPPGTTGPQQMTPMGGAQWRPGDGQALTGTGDRRGLVTAGDWGEWGREGESSRTSRWGGAPGVWSDSCNRHNRVGCQGIEFLKNSSPMGQKQLASDEIGGKNHPVKMHCLRIPNWLGKVLRPGGSVQSRMARPKRRRCRLRTTGKLQACRRNT